MVWTLRLSCCDRSILLSVFNSYHFPSSYSMPRPLACRHSLPLFNQYYTVVLKTCYVVMFFISIIPSEIRRFQFTVSWLCDDHIAADNLRRKIFSTTRPFPRCRRTTVFKEWRSTDFLPRVDWRFADGVWPSVQGADKLVKCSILRFA
jgi:hypothetical protein